MTVKEPLVAQALVANAGPSDTLRASALKVLSRIFAASVVGYLLAAPFLSLGRGAIAAALLLLLLIFAIVLHGLRHHRFERFGPANTVTAIRAALVCIVAAAVCCASLPQSGGKWLWVLAILAFSLDAVDGYLARRYHLESPLGARFDMEIDAMLILCLSAAAFLLEKAGIWVLLIGLMRYAFILAQSAMPRLNALLPASFRRKFVCVVQIVVLCLVLLPQVAVPVSSWLAAAALVLLTYSFAADCVYLVRRADDVR